MLPQKMYFECARPVVAMYSEPAHKSEMKSQLLSGEYVYLLESQGIWCLVATAFEDYEGWVLQAHLTPVDEVPKHYSFSKSVFSQGINKFTLPLAALNSINYPDRSSIEGLLGKFPTTASEQLLLKCVHCYMGAPYLWGGRTHFGIDCSGFVNIIYKFFNIHLPHDAEAQSKHGLDVPFLEQAAAGDLAFFDNEEGKINHVGILISNNEIIHSSEINGGVSIDFIDVSGVVNKLTNKHTHKLRFIKRITDVFPSL